MGTTIRRQPVSFDIPDSPDYKFLNVTDFGGLSISSNPFVVSSNTASDCLNVYVDEDNALSTRPRLQLKYDLIALAGLDDSYELIDIYNLHNGYLLHTKKGSTGYMYRFTETNGVLQSPVIITGTKPTNKCNIFEQNGNIYLLTGDGYKNIIENEISDVDGYIPTTTIGKNKRVVESLDDGSKREYYDLEGSSYESLNLISNKYKETYFWDGVSEFIPDSNAIETQNNYYVLSKALHDVSVITYYDDNTFLYKKNSENNGYLYYGVLHPDFDSFEEFDTGIDLSSVLINGVDYDVLLGVPNNTTLKQFIVITPYLQNASVSAKSKQYQIDSSNNTIKEMSIGDSISNIISQYTSDSKIYMSENLKYVWFDDKTGYVDADDGGWSVQDRSQYDISILGLITPYDKTNYKIHTLHISDIENDAYIIATKKDVVDGDPVPFLICYAENFGMNSNLTFTLTKEYDGKTEKPENIHFLPNGSGFYTNTNDTEFKFYFKTDSFNEKSVMYSTGAKNFVFTLSPNTHASFINTSGDLYYIKDYSEPSVYYKLPIKINEDLKYFNPGKIYNTSTNGRYSIYSYQSSNEPLITVVHTIPTETEQYTEVSNLYSVLKTSKLFERFDNNTWFASGNYTFHTLYNDPTYIPLSSYNDLGEDFEDITGLSIVNDNVLAAYKRNRIYIITPVTVGDQETYSYTETKNVIGNDVLDAPILTILTEMPTIVSYDGIYALNQLENVQSSDRITTLISENINPRWLKESTADIDECKTLNRLYWTYYILPHRKVDDETKDYTKIYLLDNRTQQWYYWELPIYIVNAMVKDNKTHFVHENGAIFTLETSDLIHEYNPDVTEYYDKVDDEKLIIPWHWISQILSLSTINYSKKLVDTTFILTDTDTQDEYALDYSFKAWRKSVSETNATTITNNIHYVQSTTKRTMIPRFNFIQLRLSNTEEDLDNNKLRLVGLGLKYVLLEGLY